MSGDAQVEDWQRAVGSPDGSPVPTDPDRSEPAEAAADPQPPGAAGGSATGAPAVQSSAIEAAIGRVGERLTGVETGIGEFHRRSAHREAVIDRLHEENQVLRGGIRRAVLEPVVTDLVRLYDAITREARRTETDGEPAGILRSFADQVELTLERCGVETVVIEPGEPFRSGTHAAAAVVPTADPALQDTAVELLSAGLRDQETGRMRRPVRARFHRFIPADGPETPADRLEDDQ